MKALFITDAHLNDPASHDYRLLFDLLERYAPRMECLVVLGDLFHIWIGDNKKVTALHRHLLDMFRQLRRRGVRVFYLKGNHDFFMGRVFKRDLDVHVFENELVLDWDGCRIFASHGDTINPRDYGYRLLRLILRSRPAELLSRSLNDAVVYRLAEWLSSHASASPPALNEERIRALFLSYAQRQLEKDYQVVILGHSHIPDWEVLSQYTPQKLYLNPGSWSSHRTYIWYQHGRFELRALREMREEILFDFP